MSSETPFLPAPTRDLTCHADTLLSPGLSALGAHMGAPCSWSTEQIFWGGPSWGQCESTWWVPRYFNFSIISPTLAPMSWIMKFDLVLTTTNRGQFSGALEGSLRDRFPLYTFTALFQLLGPVDFAVCRSQFFRGKHLDILLSYGVKARSIIPPNKGHVKGKLPLLILGPSIMQPGSFYSNSWSKGPAGT